MLTPDYLKDISDEELRQYASRIEAVVSLAGDVGHDFNDILQAIRGYIELTLITTKKDSKNYGYLKEIYNSVIRGGDLTKRLLSLGKPFEIDSARKKNINDLNLEILHIKDVLDRNIPERIKIIYNLQDDIYPVYLDPQHIEQILLNLALNSVDAMPDGGTLSITSGNITLDENFCSTRKYVKPGRFIFIRMEDTGVGISSSVIKHIFDPFFSTKSKKKKLDQHKIRST